MNLRTPLTTPCSKPRSLDLTIVVDWANEQNDVLPYLCIVYFGPNPRIESSLLDAKDKNSWQIAFNILSTEKEQLINAKNNESVIAPPNRALLWMNGQPTVQHDHGILKQHCFFPRDLDLTPRVLTVCSDSKNNGPLVWVPKKEDSHFQITRGNNFHIQMTFTDGYLVNYLIEHRRWSFRGALFTYSHHDAAFRSVRPMTHIQLKGPDLTELNPLDTHFYQCALKEIVMQQLPHLSFNLPAKEWTSNHFDLQWMKEQIPTIDEIKAYTPRDIDLDLMTDSLAALSPMLLHSPSSVSLLFQVEVLNRRILQLKREEKHPLGPVAKRWIQFFAACGKLPVLELLETYGEKEFATVIKEEPENLKIASLKKRGVDLQYHALTRLHWVLQIENNAPQKASSDDKLDHMLSALARDSTWMKETDSFLKCHEAKSNFLIHSQPALFARFDADFHSTLVNLHWPHEYALQSQILQACFVFRPQILNRDRCVCEYCGVEVSGWRPWHHPWRMHNWSMSHPTNTLLTYNSSRIY